MQWFLYIVLVTGPNTFETKSARTPMPNQSVCLKMLAEARTAVGGSKNQYALFCAGDEYQVYLNNQHKWKRSTVK